MEGKPLWEPQHSPGRRRGLATLGPGLGIGLHGKNQERTARQPRLLAVFTNMIIGAGMALSPFGLTLLCRSSLSDRYAPDCRRCGNQEAGAAIPPPLRDSLVGVVPFIVLLLVDAHAPLLASTRRWTASCRTRKVSVLLSKEGRPGWARWCARV